MKYLIAALALLFTLSDAVLARGRGYSHSVSRRSSVSRARRPIVNRISPAPRQATSRTAPRSRSNRPFVSRRSPVNRAAGLSGSSHGGTAPSSRSRHSSSQSFSSFRNSRTRLVRPNLRRAGEGEEEEPVSNAILGRRIVTSLPVNSASGGPVRIQWTEGGNGFISQTPAGAGSRSIGAGRGAHYGAADKQPPISQSDNPEASGNTGITEKN